MRRWNRAAAILACYTALAYTGCGPAPSSAPPPSPPAEPLPPDVLSAWQDAGATAGWVGQPQPGIWTYRPGGDGKPGDIPAFAIDLWKEGMLSSVPHPSRPFGLSLNDAQITDAGLNTVGSMLQLQYLDLFMCIHVSDAGVKELSGLKQLQWLSLNATEVTDAGVKELTALTELRGLDLSNTQITDAALKDLAGFKRLEYLGLNDCYHTTAAGMAELKKSLPHTSITH